eukprot:scaffold6677_cov155-Skeletonema_menzelii.AAC.13
MMHLSNLRGGVADHIREVQDAIKAAAEKIPQAQGDIDYFPNVEGEEREEAHHGRRLAEETPYGIDMVNAEYVQNKARVMTEPIKMCVADTGYDLGHVDLPKAEDGVQGWADPNGSYGAWDVDGHGHGTHCAGTIGAIGGNNNGVIGVLDDPSDFQFVIGKALSDSGSGSSANVLNAVQACQCHWVVVVTLPPLMPRMRTDMIKMVS